MALKNKNIYFVFAIVMSTIFVSYLHYSTGIEAHALHGIYAELYYIPLLLGALLGLKGAVFTYLFVSGVYLPFIFLNWMKSPLFLTDKLLHLLFSGIFAILAGILMDREKRYRKQLEEDKIKLEELDKLKSSFLANISHELKTPMTSIMGYTDLLLDSVDGPLSEEQEKSLKKISSHSKHLLQLINDILDVSRLESEKKFTLQPKYLDMNEMIENVLEIFTPLFTEKGLDLTLKIDENLPLAYADEDRVKQILMHLLSNAVKFTHKGGIMIKAHPSQQEAKPGEKPVFVEICIEDTGIGITDKDIQRIFDRFVQVEPFLSRTYQGAGLGLSIVKGLVEMHKGSIWVTSTYGKGSRFCFTLPVKKEILDIQN